MAAMPRFEERLISADYEYAYGLCAADVDGDGLLDLVSADAHRGLYWYANEGDGRFTRIAIQYCPRTRLERMACADLSGGGRPDIVIVDNLHGDILLFQNPGDPRSRAPWPCRYIAGPTTNISRQPLEGAMPHAYDVALADLDEDGDLDVAASSWVGNRFAWFENRDGVWVRHDLEDDLTETRTIAAADFNGDGRPDLLGTASAAGEVLWYENPGGQANGGWRRRRIAHERRPVHGHPADMNGDGIMDVVMALGMGDREQRLEEHLVAWYENPGSNDGVWTRHVIGGLPNAFEAVAADLDGDGNVEVVASSWAEDGQVVVFRHRGDPAGPWDRQVLKDRWPRANQVIVADLDGDGRLDIAATAERGANEIRWWRNLG
jgi:hypothetical protein